MGKVQDRICPFVERASIDRLYLPCNTIIDQSTGNKKRRDADFN